MQETKSCVVRADDTGLRVGTEASRRATFGVIFLDAETLTITDTVQRDTKKVVTEQIVLSHVQEFRTDKSILETIPLLDLTAKQLTRSLDLETAQLVDAVTKGPERPLLDTLTLSSLIAKIEILHNVPETVQLLDADNLHITHKVTETLELTDTASKNPRRLLSESIEITDVVQRFVDKAIKETLTLSKVLQFDIKRDLVESVTLSDPVKKEIFRALVEEIALTDVVERHPGKSILETLDLSFVIDRELMHNELVTVNVQDVTEKQLTRTLPLETVTPEDMVRKDTRRDLTEQLTLSFTLNPFEILHNVPETVSILDADNLHITHYVLETLNITDTTTKDMHRDFDEEVALSLVLQNNLRRIFVEEVLVDYLVTRDIVPLLDLESVTISDTIQKIIEAPRGEEITLTEETLVVDLTRSIVETITPVLEVEKYLERSLTENVSLVGLAALAPAKRVQVESLELEDFPAKRHPGKAVPETLNLTDVIQRVIAHIVPETVFVLDADNRNVTHFVMETITLTENLDRDLVRVLPKEILTLVDQVTKRVTKSFLEEITLSEGTSRRLPGKSAKETINLTVDLRPFMEKHVLEVLPLEDEVYNNLSRAISEFITLSAFGLVVGSNVTEIVSQRGQDLLFFHPNWAGTPWGSFLMDIVDTIKRESRGF